MVEKPIIIVGTGRCGSTIFQNIFCEHPNVSWLSAFFDIYAGRPEVNKLLMGLVDLPAIGNTLKRQKYLRPWEPYGVWDRAYPGFREPFRDLRADDVTPRTKTLFHKSATKLLTAKRNRLLIKITGWPRLGFLSTIFPDAKFIHIVRDGRAVVNSLLTVDWWSGWGGVEAWRWGPLSDCQKEQWDQYGQSFVALASIEWNILMDAFVKAQPTVPTQNYLELRYEDFCDDVVGTFRTVSDFCELDWAPRLAQAMGQYRIEDKNFKWKQDLNEAQQMAMNDIMGPYLTKYGYIA